jgi:hypothetical protein
LDFSFSAFSRASSALRLSGLRDAMAAAMNGANVTGAGGRLRIAKCHFWVAGNDAMRVLLAAKSARRPRAKKSKTAAEV